MDIETETPHGERLRLVVGAIEYLRDQPIA
jgi:hypothetical protein